MPGEVIEEDSETADVDAGAGITIDEGASHENSSWIRGGVLKQKKAVEMPNYILGVFHL